MIRTQTILLASLLVLTACSGDPKPPLGEAESSTAAARSVAPASWMEAVVQDTALLGPFEQGTTGDAWLALYHNDLSGAGAAFGRACQPSDAPLGARREVGYPCVGLTRVELMRAELFAVVADMDRVARRQFYAHRLGHPEEVLASKHEGFFRGVVLLHSGARDEGLAVLQAYAASGADAGLAELAQRIVAGVQDGDALVQRLWGGGERAARGSLDLASLPASPGLERYRGRLEFAEHVANEDLDAASAGVRGLRLGKPDLREDLDGGSAGGTLSVRISHSDPVTLMALARYHALRALRAAGGAPDLAIFAARARVLLGEDVSSPAAIPGLPDGLPMVVFSGVPLPQDLTGILGPRPATLERLAAAVPALGAPLASDRATLDPFVAAANATSSALRQHLGELAPHGGSLNADMGLDVRFRGQLLRERALALRSRFAVALDGANGADMATAGVMVRSLLELSLDATPSPPNPRLKKARVSFRNDPLFLVRLAQANLDTRRPYEANEYVRPLTELFDALIPLRDSLTALDSAWNPMNRGSVR